VRLELVPPPLEDDRRRRRFELPEESGAPILWALLALVGWLAIAGAVALLWWLL
jgi:hypothetical protein